MKPVYPAKGKILFEGKPIPNGLLVLLPVGEEKPDSRQTPRARVKDDGEFELSTHSEGDGAPEGKYRVTVFWYERWLKNVHRDDELGKNLLPEKYQDPKCADLPTIEIKAQANELPIINLKKK